MNFAQILVIAIAATTVIISGHTHKADATCATGPGGATICAGISEPTNIAKSNSTTSIAYNGNPQVIITPNCAANDIRYGSYSNTCYHPTTLYVKSGTMVTWQNNDTLQHTVTYGSMWSELSQGYFFDSRAMEPGESYSYQFKYPGAYPYFDKFNWWETGLVIVKK